LVAVQAELPSRGLQLEDARALRMQNAVRDQFVDPVTGLERRVYLDQRLGPEQAVTERALDVIADPRIRDLKEAPRVRGVVLDQLLPEIEDVHRGASLAEVRM